LTGKIAITLIGERNHFTFGAFSVLVAIQSLKVVLWLSSIKAVLPLFQNTKDSFCVRITSARGRDSLKQQYVPSVTQSKFHLICKEKSLNGLFPGQLKVTEVMMLPVAFSATVLFGKNF